MKLYEIDNAILECVDNETGEILDFDKLSELQLARDEKLESVALWIKNLNAEMAAYKAEKEAFAEREKRAKNKIESLKNYLAYALKGSPFNTTKVAISFKPSESVDVDENLVPKKWLKRSVSYSPDKIGIKAAIKSGLKIKGCSLVKKQNIQIK